MSARCNSSCDFFIDMSYVPCKSYSHDNCERYAHFADDEQRQVGDDSAIREESFGVASVLMGRINETINNFSHMLFLRLFVDEIGWIFSVGDGLCEECTIDCFVDSCSIELWKRMMLLVDLRRHVHVAFQRHDFAFPES